MPIASPRYAFNATMIAGAPPDPGVFALWQNDELIYYGRALGNGATIQPRLREHLETGPHRTSGPAPPAPRPPPPAAGRPPPPRASARSNCCSNSRARTAGFPAAIRTAP